MARRKPADSPTEQPVIRVRRIHRRDLNRVWDFLKKVFRLVNRETVEYQRPRTKTRFLEIYEEEGIEQLLFEVHEGAARHMVGYAECAYEVIGSDNWINERYFDNRDMRPLFVEEIAIHPDYQGRGIGSFVIEQLEHLARVHGCTHLVLEVAANNKHALQFYRARSFAQLDAAIFLAKKVISEPELLPPRPLRPAGADDPVPAPAEPAPEDIPEAPPDDAPPAFEPLAEALPVRRRKRAAPASEDIPVAPRRKRTSDTPVPEDIHEAAPRRKRAASKHVPEDIPEAAPRRKRAASKHVPGDIPEAAPARRQRAATPKPSRAPAKAKVASRRAAKPAASAKPRPRRSSGG